MQVKRNINSSMAALWKKIKMYLYKFIKNKIEKEKNVNCLSKFIQMLKKYYKEFKVNDNMNLT